MQGCLSHINVIHQGSNSPLAHHEQFHSLGVRIRTLSARIHETLIWVGANLHLQHLVRDRRWLFRRLLWRRRRDKLLGCWYSQRKLQSCTNEDVPFVRCRLKHLPSRRALTGFCASTRAKVIERPNFRRSEIPPSYSDSFLQQGKWQQAAKMSFNSDHYTKTNLRHSEQVVATGDFFFWWPALAL